MRSLTDLRGSRMDLSHVTVLNKKKTFRVLHEEMQYRILKIETQESDFREYREKS